MKLASPSIFLRFQIARFLKFLAIFFVNNLKEKYKNIFISVFIATFAYERLFETGIIKPTKLN